MEGAEPDVDANEGGGIRQECQVGGPDELRQEQGIVRVDRQGSGLPGGGVPCLHMDIIRQAGHQQGSTVGGQQVAVERTAPGGQDAVNDLPGGDIEDEIFSLQVEEDGVAVSEVGEPAQEGLPGNSGNQ
jgi:hypothetical protein